MVRLLLGLSSLMILAVSPGLAQDKKPPLSFPSDLYPLAKGNRWVYQGNEPKDKVVQTVERMEPVKRSINIGGRDRVDTIESFVLRIANGDKALSETIMVTDDGIYRYAAAGKEIKPPMKILKLPVARGDSWTIDSKSESVDLKGEFFVDQVTVNLGKGDEQVWLAKTRDFRIGDQAMETSYWFKPGQGIVKQHVKSGKFDFRITLETFTPAAVVDAVPGWTAPPPTQPSPLPSLPKLPPQLELK